jgi:succinyl-diaminopimelate desuccinylase
VTDAGVRPASAAVAREGLADRLRRRTVELVDMPSPSGREGDVRSRLEAELQGMGWLIADRADSCLVAVTPRKVGRPFVLLAGHLDTVPAQENAGASVVEPGTHVAGCGSVDMKGAVAVAVELADDVAAGRIALEVDVGVVLFGREELPIADSALRPLLARCEAVRAADLAIVMEPTANALELGCLGNLNADLTFVGESAHSARPWLGRNAIHASVRRLATIAALPAADVEVEGLVYREVVSVTGIEGGIARNVVPDRVFAHVNLRYAPGRDPDDAVSWLRRLLAPPGERGAAGRSDEVLVDVVSNAPPAMPARANPLVERLRAAGGLSVRAKQAWTPVAEFAEAGIDAVNFGPGDPALAHRADERVAVEALVRAHGVLARFLAGSSTPVEDASS